MNDKNSELQSEVEATEAEKIVDFSDDDLAPTRPKIESVTIETPSGKNRRVFVRRLTGKQVIDFIERAGETDDNGKRKHKTLDVALMKLTRCLVNANSSPLFSDASALKLINDGDADLLNALLRAVHEINPTVKNA